MKIKCLTTFLDGTDRFEKDDQRTVDDDRGRRFCANGWADSLGGEAPQVLDGSADTALDIQRSAVGHKAATVK